MQVEGDLARIAGDLTLAESARVLAEAGAALAAGTRGFDLGDVTHVDSSALSLLLAIRRRAPKAEFQHVPESLLALAKLYGVAELL